MSELKEKAVTGVFWSFIERFGSQFILMLSQIILANLLSPKDFGMFAMLTIFIAISQTFIDSGFDNALIQKNDVTDSDYSTVFYFNIIIAVVIYIILFFAAPYVADFYNTPVLELVMRVVCFSLVFSSFGLIQFVKFKIDMDFKSIANVVLIANLLSSVIAIIMAMLGYEIWALVAQIMGLYFFRTLFFWIKSSWRPKWHFSFKSFKSMFSFGSKLLMAGLLNEVFENIYNVVIGRMFPAASLGFFDQAKKMQNIPITTLAKIVGNVTLPAFSKVQNQKEKLQYGFDKSIKFQSFLSFPMMAGLAVVAEPVISFLIGDKWLPCVPYLQLMCIAGMIYTLHTSNLNILVVKGRSDLFLKLEIIKKIIIVIAIIIGLNWGILGLVIGQVVTSFISLIINAYFTRKLIDFGVIKQIKAIKSTMLLTIVMVAFMGLGFFIESQLWRLLFQILIGGTTYLFFAFLFKVSVLTETLTLVKNFKTK